MEVHWLEQTEADLPEEDHWLSPGEALRSSGMRIAKRRKDWRLGRWTAKRAVAIHFGLPFNARALAGIEILAAPSGAPEVFIGKEPAQATISISHRAGEAVCALAGGDVALGCDLELIEPRSGAFATDYFTAAEQALVADASVADQPKVLTLLWSAKESVLKALRVGLRLDLRRVTVDPGDMLRGPAEVWLPLEARCEEQIFRGWWRHTGLLVRTLVAVPAPSYVTVYTAVDSRIQRLGGAKPCDESL